MTVRFVMVRFVMALLVGLLSTAGTYAADEASKAATIATTVCVACHGADGNSIITANPRLAGQHPEYLAKQLNNFKSGERKNPVMGPMASTLSAEDVLGVAAYFGAQKAKTGNAKENGPGSMGEKIYKGGVMNLGVPACAACHGPNGAGIPVRFPRLAGQHAEYITNQLKAFRSGERANGPMMRAIAEKMSDQQIAAVADYIQGLH
jgi:cytochrome c553